MQTSEVYAEKAILCGVHTGFGGEEVDTTEASMAELAELAQTAGAEVLAQCVQNRPFPENATYFGEGKLQEVAASAEQLGADLLIFDNELSPAQIRNIEKTVGVRAIDRSMLIMDIFAKHADSAEGKIQVEIAQLRYMLPRLTGLGREMSRLGAGIGTKGPGETKLETDKRHIRRRIEFLQDELDKMSAHRNTKKRAREKAQVPTAALVGYTNAGKSTLLNKLCNADVLVRDMLFATLDPAVRRIEFEDKRKAVLADTVGFIRKLPHHLIKAFKSTLEQVKEADVLIHVIDSSAPEMENQINVVDNLLLELGCEGKPIIAAFNKIDMVAHRPRTAHKYSHIAEISALTGEGIFEFKEALKKHLFDKRIRIKVMLPYSQGGLLSYLHDKYQLGSETHTHEGTLLDVNIDAEDYHALKQYEQL